MSELKHGDHASLSDSQLPAGADTRLAWAKPEITVVMPVSRTQGAGAAGTDFGSEISV